MKTGLGLVTQLSQNLDLYTTVVWSISLKRKIRICYLLNTSASSTSYAVLFCTNLKLDAFSIYLYYKARFQIELIFRDSKQFTGLAQSLSAQIVVRRLERLCLRRQARDCTNWTFISILALLLLILLDGMLFNYMIPIQISSFLWLVTNAVDLTIVLLQPL